MLVKEDIEKLTDYLKRCSYHLKKRGEVKFFLENKKYEIVGDKYYDMNIYQDERLFDGGIYEGEPLDAIYFLVNGENND